MSWENMSWEKAAHNSAVLQFGLAVLQFTLFGLSIYFVWKQLGNQTEQLKKQGIQLGQQAEQMRQQVQLTRAANTHALVALASPFNLELARDEKMAELWANGGKSGLTGVRESLYENMLIWWLVFYENIFVQEHNELLEKSISDGWKKNLASFVEDQAVENYWPQLENQVH